MPRRGRGPKRRALHKTTDKAVPEGLLSHFGRYVQHSKEDPLEGEIAKDIEEFEDYAPSSPTYMTVEDFKKALGGPPERFADRLRRMGPDPTTIAPSLTIAVRHAADIPPEAFVAPAEKIFDLGALKDVEDYLEETENDIVTYLKPLDTTVAECQTTLIQLRKKKLLSEAEQMIRIDNTEKLNVIMLTIVAHFVYDLQTFNADKRWEPPERSLYKMRESKSLEAYGPPQESVLNLVDMFNDPQHFATFKTTHRSILERKAREEKYGKTSIPAARSLSCIKDGFSAFGAAARKCNGVLGRMAQSLVPLSWETFIQHYPGVSSNLPRRIREYFLELVFLRAELQSLQFEVVYMIYFLRELLKVWWRAGPEAWEFGKEHVYVMAHFREYEFARHALLSTQYLILRLDYKIAKFSRTAEGRKYTIPEAYDGLKEKTCDAAWQDWFESVSEDLLSVEELIEREEREETVKEEYFEEQRVLAEKLKEQMMEALREEKGKAKKQKVEALRVEEGQVFKKEKRMNGKGKVKA
ncbi:hypothetical protein JMJ35_003084 [Cladonia borealis]|uniref:Uncharacterized protein n=1 Tax=Cladonia borealis TaxID=184061 RepID=A0AA39V3H9_9LECA|nr:hypothetical protein JMJ35_003084 [Cladonia borealis]